MPPHVIDSTMLSTLGECPKKFEWAFENRLRPRDGSTEPLDVGAAFHEAIYMARKTYWETEDPESGKLAGVRRLLSAAPDTDPGSSRSLDKILAAYDLYTNQFPLEKAQPLVLNGRPMFEVTFSIPLPINNLDGQPFLYSGRIDMIVNTSAGVYLLDDKTTTRMGPSWGDGWDLRFQFLGYMWAASQFGIDSRGVIVRGIKIANQPEVREAIIYRKDWLISEWYDNMLTRVSTLLSKSRPKALGRPCEWCSYVVLCKSQHPERWFNTFDIQEEWSPLHHKEKEIAQ
jgi:hypothetical protein